MDVVDLQIELVDGVVVVDDLLRHGIVSLDERLDRPLDRGDVSSPIVSSSSSIRSSESWNPSRVIRTAPSRTPPSVRPWDS